MKVLITGGAGFIGSHIANAYLSNGHEVTIADVLSTGFRRNVPGKAKFLEADVNSDAMDAIFREGKFDFVSHHAAQINVRTSVENPVMDAETNILSTIRLLTLSVKYGVKHFVFASTGGAIYGEQEYFPADEKHPLRPASPYGIAKMTGEEYCRFFSETYGLKTTCFRYGNVYGPLQSPHGEAGVIAIFAECFLKGKTAFINGNGEQTRDYVHVDDVVEANRLALAKDIVGTYNIGTGVETSVNRIFDLVRESCGSSQEPLHREAKKGEQTRSVLDTASFAKATGWKASVNIERGIRTTVDSFRKELANG